MTSVSTELGRNFNDVIPQTEVLVALRDSTINGENRPGYDWDSTDLCHIDSG